MAEMSDRYAELETLAKAFETLLGGCAWLELQMSDTFAFSTAEGEKMDPDHALALLPLISKYGRHALTAYAAVKKTIERGHRVEPIRCKCCHDAPEYHEARAEVEAMVYTDERWPREMFLKGVDDV